MESEKEPSVRKRGRPSANKDLSIVLEAAAKIFAKKGFDGAQIKEIAEEANFSASLLHYHFSDKEDLWKKTVSKLGQELLNKLVEVESYFRDLEGVPLLKAYNRQFIYFSAQHPEFFKIAFHEIGNESHRAEWILDDILAPVNKQFLENIKKDSSQDSNFFSNFTPAHSFSLLVGAANMFFALSFQMKRQYGIDVFDEKEIDHYVDFVNGTIFARFKS